MAVCEICRYLAEGSSPVLYENDDWKLLLREDDQEYLGKAVVDLKRHASRVSDIKPEEWVTFGEVTRWYEERVSKLFTPTHYNWQCLMNLGAAEGDTRVHWHATPRYNQPVEFGGETYRDQCWPQSCSSVERRPVDDETAGAIASAIITALD